MPVLNVNRSRRRRRTLADDEESDDSAGSRGSTGSKRARLSNSAVEESVDDVLPESYRAVPRPGHRSNGAISVNGSNGGNGTNGTSSPHDRDPEGFRPGSIVRVKLINFVTYTEAEFKLGPNLNMIIGPNGTGKSTFVCAVCVGLGFAAQTMGRAKEVGEYIKKGTEDAAVEIELAAGPKMSKNPVIRREIHKDATKKRDASTTNWFINDRKVPQKDVDDIVRKKFAIQIDNLCQFLPQDRVVEFSGLTPTELLKATLEATAPKQMQEWHNELIALDKQQQGSELHREGDNRRLEELKTRQAAQKGDVDRMHERSGLAERLGALEKYRVVLQYRDAKNKFTEAKSQLVVKQKELVGLKKEIEPSLEAVRSKEQYCAKIDRWHGQRKKQTERWEETVAREKNKHDDIAKQIEDCDNKYKAEMETNKKRNNDIKRTENVINSLKAQQEQQPPPFDAAEYNKRIRDKDGEIAEIAEKAREVRAEMSAMQQQARELQEVRKRADESLERLKTQAGQQARVLARLSPETARAWQWVQNNQHCFQEKVYGPPIVECSVTDPNYASALESLLGRNDFLTFTVTNRPDRDKLSEALTGRNGMGLTDITIKNSMGKGMEGWHPPCSEEELRSFGLESWALSKISGPEAVLSILCDFNGLHRTGVTSQKHTEAQFERIRDHSKISRWTDKDAHYNVARRREYGPNAVSTGTKWLKAPDIWKAQGQGANMEEDLELRKERDDATEKIEELKKSNAELKQKLESFGQATSDVEAEKAQIVEEKDGKQKVWADFRAIPVKLSTQEEKLRGYKEAQLQWQTGLDQILTTADGLVYEKGQVAIKVVNAVEALRKAIQERFEAELWTIEANSDLEMLLDKNKEAKELLEQAQMEINRLTRAKTELKSRAEKFIRDVTAMHAERTQNEEDIHHTLNDAMSTEELEGEIEVTSNRLGLLQEGDPRLLQDYENRAKAIEKLEQKLRDSEANLQALKNQISSIREQWEPRLDELVGDISDAFSANFSKIGCAGQVEVYKDDSFENWSIRIRVKFRENEPLSVLTSQRQSGGERSVSTILYLLSLHSMSKAPFRVVDEINQGMDPRNERAMHERIVDISCEESYSQYFLVTPKLLTDLKFHPRMKIHFIQSGDWMPKKSKILDPANSISIMRRLAAKA